MPLSRIAAAAVLLAALTLAPARADNWPMWRGPTGQGFSAEKNLPTKWSPTENVKWKIDLPDAASIQLSGTLWSTSKFDRRFLIGFGLNRKPEASQNQTAPATDPETNKQKP